MFYNRNDIGRQPTQYPVGENYSVCSCCGASADIQYSGKLAFFSEGDTPLPSGNDWLETLKFDGEKPLHILFRG